MLKKDELLTVIPYHFVKPTVDIKVHEFSSEMKSQFLENRVTGRYHTSVRSLLAFVLPGNDRRKRKTEINI